MKVVSRIETLAIIGGGPAGYVAAITAAQQGKKVMLIEEQALGGTCLNEGCMPTKALLESAEILEKVKAANHFGVKVEAKAVSLDWKQVQSYKTSIVQKLVAGITYLMKKNKITVYQGTASFLSERTIQVVNNEETLRLEADKCIIAAGSEPIALPFASFDEKWLIDSKTAMSLPMVPSSLIIIGGGVIGCEFASIYSRIGTSVTMIEMANQLLPGEDTDIAEQLQTRLEQEGVKIYTSTKVKDIDKDSREVVIESNDTEQILQGDYVLVSIGRKPRVANLGLEKIGVFFTEKGLEVNEHMQTNVPTIYACGDIVGGIQLAHVAFHEGMVAALHACGEEVSVNYRAVPRCIYTSPEIASVGLTEKQAKEKYGDIRVGEFSFAANGKALILNEQSGKVKVVMEPELQEIVGVTIIGPKATELIAQGTLMLHSELTADVMESFIAAHPTLSEAVHEAVLNAVGHAIHS